MSNHEHYIDDEELDALLTGLTEVMPNEVVTSALSRDVELPGGAGTCVLITLDNGQDHTRPTTLGPGSLRELNHALDAARARGDIAAIAVTGKPYFLAAGADLSAFENLRGREDAEAIVRVGHGVYEKLHSDGPGSADGGVPTFCFINGLALGGGFEVALNCDYRTVSAGIPAAGLPEVFLGILPGWGGAFLLPNLIGVEAALQVIITNPLSQNRMLTGADVAKLGIADALFEPADFLERSLAWTADVLTGATEVERPEVDRDEARWEAGVAKATAFADAKVSGAAPAPYRALELVSAARTTNRVDAFRAEDTALADLLMSQESRASLYAFNLVQKRAKRPAGAPDKSLARKVGKVGVVGAGLMASQLALLFVRRLKVPVVMSDLDAERVAQGVGHVEAEIDKLVAKKRMKPDAANRAQALISGSTDKADFADCDFVIEAVFEELSVKKQVFAELEEHVGPECVLATNTSSLSVSQMAADLDHPERVVGFHFFNPVAVLPLLEIARAEKTDDTALATAFAVSKSLNKNAVLVSDATAFVVNRVLVRMLCEITAVIDEGTPIEQADAAMAPLGLPMPPMVLMELVGPAIGLHVAESLHASFGERFHVSPNLKKLVEAKIPNLYLPEPGPDGSREVNPQVVELFELGENPSSAEEILERVVNALAEEIGLLLAEDVVADPKDVDLCLILGAGWPFHLGGITPYLDRSGVSERVNEQRFAAPGVATLPADAA